MKRTSLFCVFSLSLVFVNTVLAASWETASMRAPGGGLVRLGMTRQEVLSELGKPLGTHSVSRYTVGGSSKTKASAWTYRGSDGMYTLYFSGEQVVKISVTADRD
jgi:Protein of unknown function (DUF2845)